MTAYIPKRGDLVWLHFNPHSRHEQAGKRPALVVSDASYNKKVGLALIFPITSKIKGYPFEVPIKGKIVNGVILSDQMKSLDWVSRNAQYIESIPEGLVVKAIKNISLLLEAS